MSQPRFVPRPGQTDYTNIKRAPVINCILKNKGRILLVQRSPDLNFYPGYWSGISGFLDDDRSVEEKVKEELKEELGMEESDIVAVKQGAVFEQEDPQYDKTWVIHPVLVIVKTDKVKLDWEAQRYIWILPAEAGTFDLLPGFDMVLERTLSLPI
jgi:ADP-ribose pyrophosphatase YjhB (NUDIX family)